MSSAFQSEMKSWAAVLRLRQPTVLFFGMTLSLLIGLFLLLLQQYQTFSAHVSRLTDELEIVVEVDPTLSGEQLQTMEKDIQQLSGVKQLEYWSQERAAEYIDQQMLPGYLDFLKKTQSEIPVNALFRIQLAELGQKEQLEQLIAERYAPFVITTDTLLDHSGQTFAQQFVGQLRELAIALRNLAVLVFALALALQTYLLLFFLGERTGGFHLAQFLHLAPPYEVLPAFALALVFSAAVIFLGVFWALLLSGQWLWPLALVFFLLLAVLDFLVVWIGKFFVMR